MATNGMEDRTKLGNIIRSCFVHASLISSECEAQFGGNSISDPRERESHPGHCVFQLKPIWEAADFLCADLCHEGGVLDRVLHIRAGWNVQLNELDKFFRALILPGILKMQKLV